MISNLFSQFLFKFLTGFFSIVFGVMAIPFTVNRELPKAPDVFTPVLRFAVTSDVHLNGEPDQAAGVAAVVLFGKKKRRAEEGQDDEG